MRRLALLALAVILLPAAGRAQSAIAGDTIHISRATGPIKIDGDLSDEAWQHATRIEKWYETQPGDNLEPKVRNVGYLTYDDRFLYAGFEFDDPRPEVLRAPFAERDNISGNGTDYGGILIDGRGTGTTGAFFVATPRNVQYDSITDDASGENSAPDFFWDSATTITARGWTLEIRIPFSSIRYRRGDPQTWRVMLYRNYPRDFHYQFFSAKIPRDGNCFVCNANVLDGLEKLPQGGHYVVAPYTTATDTATAGSAGDPLSGGIGKGHIGADVKLLPNADNAIDLTIKPDFSQIESDTAQISTNQRFALFFPERRPFFLEGVDLFSTPIQAVYTRTITDPLAGGRVTGKEQGIRYTVLVADDTGGGSTVIPGPLGSSLAPVDFGSTVFIARAKRDIGLSFVSMLATDREHDDGNGHNRVVGPDFQWRAGKGDVVAGQLLYSDTATPNLPDATSEWNGETLTGRASHIHWSHNAKHLDWWVQYGDATDGFRADTGFVPQVGFRDFFASPGWTVRPEHFALSRIREFLNLDRQVDMSGRVIGTNVEPGVGMDAKWNGFLQFRASTSQTRTTQGALFTQHQFHYYVQFSPSPALELIEADGGIGDQIDFDNSRLGHGPILNFNVNIRPTTHLQLATVENLQWLDISSLTGASERLFTAQVSRLKATYTFTSRLYARVIGQYVSTTREPSLYLSAVDAKSGDFSGSGLFAYKLNWQSVLFIGYGDDRELTQPAAALVPTAPAQRLAPLDRQFFVKVSYAFQR
ncbi:MAG TPA: DUF5916 domain-containing protein [Vicinamibacterales bacterium]|nr:DUF5916 domain-containing protein [Vicinamibacterales bacterium]